ncbi:MAG TPA: 2-phosphosulfolactate phosphatase [Streptosporangiales bacterium]
MADVHDQSPARVRMEWGPVGADALAPGVDCAVVVDVLSFTTTLSVAVDLGAEVFPYRWQDATAAEFARSHDAVLAVGRFEARASDGPARVSLSPHSIRSAVELRRLVLPSPNGSSISARLAESGVPVVAACLRNRAAVARWLVGRAVGNVAVIPAGERWPDGSLRPAVEDLWGAGAVIAALDDLGMDDLSPEAAAAAAAFRVVRADVLTALRRSSGGRELAAAGFDDDVAVAAEVDASEAVPLLASGRFVDAA